MRQRDEDIREEVKGSYEAVARGERSCCGAAPPKAQQEQTHEEVKRGYGEIASRRSEQATSSSCCGGSAEADFAATIGYTAEELAEIPEEANLGWGAATRPRSPGSSPARWSWIWAAARDGRVPGPRRGSAPRGE